jgi:hypothetical protein
MISYAMEIVLISSIGTALMMRENKRVLWDVRGVSLFMKLHWSYVVFSVTTL